MKQALFKALLPLFFIPLFSQAQNWDHVTSHPEQFYFGEGYGKTVEEATGSLKAAIAGQIVTRVTSEAEERYNEVEIDGKTTFKSEFKNYINSYTRAVLNNVVSLPPSGKAPKIRVRGWIKRSDVEKEFAERARTAKGYISQGDSYLDRNMIKEALENYYYAYICICSLQAPSSVKDNNGISLTVSLPNKVKEIMNSIDVEFKSKEDVGNEIEVELTFTRNGTPVRSIEYLYNDGNIDNVPGRATDGTGVLRMAPSYSSQAYHVNIKHTYKDEAGYDAMLSDIAEYAPEIIYKENYKLVDSSRRSKSPHSSDSSKKEDPAKNSGITLTPTENQIVADPSSYMDVLHSIFKAIKERQYSTLAGSDCFTTNGKDIFDRLIKYGKASIIGTPDIHFFKGPNGSVVARGLQMSFSFNRGGRKNTFVEDVVFAFDRNGKIDNIAFGLGEEATNDLLCKDTPRFTYQEREQIIEFLESYKTAYCLERKDFIETIFSDDAVIITGYVVKSKQPAPGMENSAFISNDDIAYERHTKTQYMQRLERIFRNNEFINIHFADNKVQPIIKFEDRKLYGITIRQHYTSATYSDKGYLFLYIDMTAPDEPTIIARTWQPDFIDPEDIIGIGNF